MTRPRDENNCLEKIKKSCSVKALAVRSHYSYPKGSTTVEGPSVHLLRAVAGHWMHLDWGWSEVETKEGKGNVPGWTKIRCYCLDLETNSNEELVYTVHHYISTRKGKKVLTDPRDIYELVANMGARRVRAMLQHVIPSYVWEEASDLCKATIKNTQEGEDLKSLIQSMIEKFSEYGVKKENLEKRLGHKIEATSRVEIITLGGIYNSIKDGYVPASEHFPEMDMTEEVPEEPSFDDPVDEPPAKSVKKAKKSTKKSTKKADPKPAVPNYAPGADNPPEPEEPPQEEEERDMTKRVSAEDEEWASLVGACQDKGLSQEELSQMAEEGYGVKTGGLTREQCVELSLIVLNKS
jgi:hypothetical protein